MFEEKMKETKSFTKENLEENYKKKFNFNYKRNTFELAWHSPHPQIKWKCMWGIGSVRPDQRVKIDKRNLDNPQENIENKTEIKKKKMII